MAGIGVTAASAATPLSVTTTSPLPLAPLNTPYSTTLAATGGTGSYTWSVATGSTLPNWLSLDSTTGVLSGTPTANATATFAVTVTDLASPADTATSGQLTLYAGNGGTEPFSLNMTSGSWTVVSTPPGTSQPFPAQTTTALTGTVAPLTGAITGATLSLPVQDGVCSAAAGGCTNYIMTEADPGTATGQINSNGDITLNDSLSYELDVIDAAHRPVLVDSDQHDLPVHSTSKLEHRRRNAQLPPTTPSRTSAVCQTGIPTRYPTPVA